MHRFLTVFCLIILISILPFPANPIISPAAADDTPLSGLVDVVPASDVFASSLAAVHGETFTGQSVCLPDIYLQVSESCLALGPSTFLTRMAQKGLVLPLRASPAVHPDAALSAMTDSYILVTKHAIPLYASLEDAAARTTTRSLAYGMKYLAITQRVEANNEIYYQLSSGGWVEAGEAGASCCIRAGRFLGLVFNQTPRNNFGWIVDTTTTRSAPGYQSPETGKKYFRENVVQVYAVEKADKTDWYMVGPNEWIEHRYMRQLAINTTAPKGVDGNRWIEINLYEQTMAVYDQNRLVFATLIASGLPPFYTRPGLFQIKTKKLLETMSGAFEGDRSDYYYLENVPWTMYYDDARALHGAYWRAIFGYPQSHGCINLSPGDAHWLFNWANTGEWVYVWDPSGNTPTDPKFYGPGGA
jgi:lipoprotein-anchoring transpeptidase ErfK/SrfK